MMFLNPNSGKLFFIFYFSICNFTIAQLPQWTVYTTLNSPIPDDQIKSITFDKDGNGWLGTAGGGLAQFRKDGSWKVFNSSNSGLPDNFIDSVAIDKSGVLWLATGSGVVRFDPALANSTDSKTAWSLFSSSNSGLQDNDTYPIAVDADDNKWIGTFSGVAKLSADGKWESFTHLNSGLPDDFVRSIYIDDAQNKWIGTLYGGLAKMEPAKIGSTHANWTVYATFNSRLPNNAVWPLTMDEDDNLWIGTRGGGIAKFEPELAKENQSAGWTLYSTSNCALPDNEVFSLACLPGHIVWAGTAKGGVARFDEKQNKWTVFNTFNSGLPSNEVRCVKMATEGTLWFATFDGGLAIYDEKGNGWKGTLCDNLAGFDPDHPELWTVDQFKCLAKKFSTLFIDHQKKVVAEFNNFMSRNMQNVNALILYTEFAQIKGIKGLMKIVERTDHPASADALYQVHAALDKALILDASNAEVYFLKARLFSMDSASAVAGKHDDFGSFSQAMQLARKAVNLAPGNGEYRKLLALLLSEDRNFDEAAALTKGLNDGNDPVYLLIKDFQQFNMPPEAIFLKDETVYYSKQLADSGAIPDYPSLRIHIFAIPYAIGDLEEFFHKWFSEFTMFLVDKDHKNGLTTYRQYIRFLDQRPFATGSKKELPMVLSGGIDMTVQQYTKSPGSKSPVFVKRLIEANPANAEQAYFCKVILVNYRK